MSPGQKLDIDVLLRPYGFGVEDIYVFMAAILAFMTVMAIGRSLIIRNTFATRVKLLQERRKALQSDMIAPRRRKKQYTETIHIMRRVVNRLQLIKKGQVSELNNRLISAGMRS
ncbi:MAG: hypothetical protein MK052_08645, partial [Alphaproteobacteria bacterium]|nr:hypothetical protein [Alphaproteobacteria bacterium]